ncbi:hypothetical protein QCA50_015130 [Cerrena zonata]|uniref:Uncharacterized protein n=1 Tax=Cerrena zonata TaxID=2478898 RepID=A0AAW0FW17_9APHY
MIPGACSSIVAFFSRTSLVLLDYRSFGRIPPTHMSLVILPSPLISLYHNQLSSSQSLPHHFFHATFTGTSEPKVFRYDSSTNILLVSRLYPHVDCCRNCLYALITSFLSL